MEKNGEKEKNMKWMRTGIDQNGSEKYTLSHASWAFKMIAVRFSLTGTHSTMTTITKKRESWWAKKNEFQNPQKNTHSKQTLPNFMWKMYESFLCAFRNQNECGRCNVCHIRNEQGNSRRQKLSENCILMTIFLWHQIIWNYLQMFWNERVVLKSD